MMRLLAPVFVLLLAGTALGQVCGNAVVEAGEDCDDGNTTSGDGCSATCLFEGCALTGSWHSSNALEIEWTLVEAPDGGTITGTFKGPRQSGTIDGTVDGKNIKFHVTARIPLDYTGTVDGDSMKGTMSGRGQQGDWTATHSK